MTKADAYRHFNESFPEYKGQLMLNAAELGRYIGGDGRAASIFIRDNTLSGYMIGKSIKYALPEIVDAINSNRVR